MGHNIHGTYEDGRLVSLTPSSFDSLRSYEEFVLNHPQTTYYACAFRGRGRYDKTEAASLQDARVAAEGLYEDRPVMLYAVLGGRQVHVGNYPSSDRDGYYGSRRSNP